MSAQPAYKYTETDYLEQEQRSSIKHEYYAGNIFAMVGASEVIGVEASLTLQSVAVSIALADIYEQVDFPEEGSDTILRNIPPE